MSGMHHMAKHQRHPFMVAAGWMIAIVLVITAVPCCLIYLGVRAAWRSANWHFGRLRVPGNLQQ